MALGEDDAVEFTVEFNIHLHSRSVTLDIEPGDLWHGAKYIADDAKLKKISDKKMLGKLILFEKPQLDGACKSEKFEFKIIKI